MDEVDPMDRMDNAWPFHQAGSISSIPSTPSISSIKNRPSLTAPGSQTT